jgi:hypothetical protein
MPDTATAAHAIRCGQCNGTHPTVADVTRCHIDYRGGFLDCREAATEQAAEIDAENAWLRAAEAGTPDTWAEENLERMIEACGYGPPPGCTF